MPTATIYPAMMPQITGTSFISPRPMERTITATASETKASSQFVFAILTADVDRDRPIRMITGPMTTGGKSRSSSFFPCHFIKADITK